jgi:acyl-CoA synthetase (AMP-forming)/AMP-acid ligase II
MSNLIDEEKAAVVASSGAQVVSASMDLRFGWLPEARLRTTHGDMPRVYLATSGTTGDPKSMTMDSNRLWSSGVAFMEYHHLQHSALRFWNFLPMSYLGGLYNLCLIPLSCGGSAVIDEQFSGKTFLEFWQTVDRFEINALWLVPTIVRGLLKIGERFSPEELKHRGSRIKAVFVGTAPIELAAKRRFEELFNIQMLENFALSETTFFTSETPATVRYRSEGSVGTALPYVDLKFVPTNDEKSLTEIYVKSPYLFLGYQGRDGVITNPCDKDGYLATGDLGHLDGNNILIVDGRKRDIIKKGGNYVALREMEILAEQHGAVREAAAVRVAHEFYGESYVMFIQLNQGFDSSSVADINQFIHEHAVQYKWPDSIMIKDEFPRTAGGKIKKHLLTVEG